MDLGFSLLQGDVLIIFEPGISLVKVHSLNGLGPIMALALIFVFLFGAFILVPGGYTFFFFLDTVGLLATFATMGAVLLICTTEEFTSATLPVWVSCDLCHSCSILFPKLAF